MQESGLLALSLLEQGRVDGVREQMLVLAMLGASAQGDLEGVADIERAHGGNVRPGSTYGFVRAYLLAWADFKAAAMARPTPSPAS